LGILFAVFCIWDALFDQLDVVFGIHSCRKVAQMLK